MDVREKEYKDVYEQYRLYAQQKSEIEDNIDRVKKRVAAMLHEDKMNEKVIVLSNGEKWVGKYQSQTRSSTDLAALMELVGPEDYSKIVTLKEITFLTIKKAGKDKKNLTNEKPVEDKTHFIPIGTILS